MRKVSVVHNLSDCPQIGPKPSLVINKSSLSAKAPEII